MKSNLISYFLVITVGILFNYFYKRKIRSIIRREIEDKGGIIIAIKSISFRDNIYVVTYEMDGKEIKTTTRYLGEGILEWFN